MYVYSHACLGTHIYTLDILACQPTYRHIYLHTAYMYTYIYTDIHACLFTYIHTYLHADIWINPCMSG